MTIKQTETPKFPIYIITSDGDKSNISRRDADGITERYYIGLDPLKACVLADLLNELSPYEYGLSQ